MSDNVVRALTTVAEGAGAMRDLMTLAALEFNSIHALCDRANVPRINASAERYSAAQRVELLEQSWRTLVCTWRP